MRIRGYLNKGYEPPAPFTRALLTSKKLHVRRFIGPPIDTRASSTIILDKDAKYLGLDVGSLERAEKRIGGIGGLIDAYLIEDAVMIFKTEEDVPRGKTSPTRRNTQAGQADRRGEETHHEASFKPTDLSVGS
jgi:hypothetical protein